MDSNLTLVRRKLPKLMACMTKNSLENLRNRALFGLDTLDAKGIRRRKIPLYECLILELLESGYNESSDYLQDLIYDNIQLVQEDEIGIVVDIRNREDYLEHIVDGLQKAEKFRDKGLTMKECLELLALGMHYAEKGKGILWLAEKFFLAAIAVSSRYQIDGGRLKCVCKYYYAKFLLDKFPGSDPDEPFNILTEVRNTAVGKEWPLHDSDDGSGDALTSSADMSVFAAGAIQLHRVLLSKARMIRKVDAGKAERLSRLAERRAIDAENSPKIAEAIIEIGICQLMMNNLNNALKTFERAFKIYSLSNDIDGLCETRMHLAAVHQRLGDHEKAARLLTEMGALAMQHDLRRQLGRALHLLGELHLRRERPELGTQHLTEAFSCFMGYGFEKVFLTKFDPLSNETVNDQNETSSRKLISSSEAKSEDENDKSMEVIHSKSRKEAYEEEAEQARLMMAISRGQELMASYFTMIREAHLCTVAQVKTVEWKLSRSGWWLHRKHHELVPCMCKVHNRTPLDVLWKQMEMKEASAALSTISAVFSEGDVMESNTNMISNASKARGSLKKK